MTYLNYQGFSAGIIISFFLIIILIATKKYHIKFSSDANYGPQKVHSLQIMRIGGIITLPSYLLTSYFFEHYKLFFFELSLVLIPAYIYGLREDLFKNITPFKRLIGILLSAILIKIYLGISLTDFGLFKINQNYLIIFITVLGITTLANAFNIIDGLNGLSLGTTIINLLFIFLISMKVHDNFIQNLCLFLIFPFITIILFNFPIARLFSGDAGAYVMGICVSVASILLAENNNSVNPFCSLLIIIYPLYECVRSFFRRLFAGRRIDVPDNFHLHSLIYKYLQNKINIKFANPIASCSILILPFLCSLWSYIYNDQQYKLILGIFIFVMIYEILTAIILKILSSYKI